MPKIRVSTTVAAPRRQVWQAVRDIGAHVRWMDDAEAIRITSPQQEGVGTTFVCDTRLGPFRVRDAMEVVQWREGRSMTVRHSGLVKGWGRFRLQGRGAKTRFTWEERLRFPWWMGGPVTARLAALVLVRVWRRNLANLKALVESGGI
jgi:carbon monoxide dehydrogenase subunit G